MSPRNRGIQPWRPPVMPVRRDEDVWAAPEQPREPNLRVLRGMVRRRWRTTLGTLATVFALVAVLTTVWPRSYESIATILVEDDQREASYIPGLEVLERLGRGNTLETEIEILHSRRVIGPVVDALDLHVEIDGPQGELRPAAVFAAFQAGPSAVPGTYRIRVDESGRYEVVDDATDDVIARAAPGGTVAFAGLEAVWPESPAVGELEIEVKAFARVVTNVLDDIEATRPSREGNLLELSCKAGDPDLVHQLCRAVSDEYVSLRTELQRSQAGLTADFLRGQVARIGDSLRMAEDRLEEFGRSRGGVALGEQATEEVRQYAAVKAQRDQVEAERSSLAGIMREIEAEGGAARRYRELASFPTFLGDETVSRLMETLTGLENRRSDLAQRRTVRNPELAALDFRISEVDRQILEIARSYTRSLAAQVVSLDRVLGGSRGRLAGFPERQVESARLERGVASLEQMYSLLETRLREAEVAEAVEQPTVRIVDTASLPLEPASPSVVLNLLLAIVLGLGLGVALALYQEYEDTRIHGRDALAERTSLPILSMIPRVTASGPVIPVVVMNGDDGPGVGGEGERLALPAPPARAYGEGRARFLRRQPTSDEGHDVLLETFRSLGADLRFLARHVENGDLRSVAITSASRGEGKTFTSCNLAIARASFGVNTLLIDADMRACGVSQFLGIEELSPGLSELLSGNATARAARRSLRLSDTDTLSVIPSGHPTPHAAELLETSYFEAMLAGAQALYDLVVIDTPPLNVLTDAAAIVSSVDAVLVVVRKGVTDGEALEITLERLERAGGPVVGIVMNDVQLPKAAAYGYYNYRYQESA